MASSKKTSKKSKSRKPENKTTSKKKRSTSKARKAAAKLRPSRSAPESTKAMRLTFSYDGEEVKLISQQRTEMIAPPSDSIKKGYGKEKGFWAEVRNDRDKPLYRHVMHNPTRNDAEVFPDTPGQSISREPAPKRKGVFVVVVPDTDKGEEVLLCRSSPPTKGPAKGIRALASQPAVEIARFKLKK